MISSEPDESDFVQDTEVVVAPVTFVGYYGEWEWNGVDPFGDDLPVAFTDTDITTTLTDAGTPGPREINTNTVSQSLLFPATPGVHNYRIAVIRQDYAYDYTAVLDEYDELEVPLLPNISVPYQTDLDINGTLYYVYVLANPQSGQLTVNFHT